METNNNINYIREQLSESELLAQFAEECAELSQAALKLRRVITENATPTTTTKEDAINHIAEEIADIKLCIKALGYNETLKDKIKHIYEFKCNRLVKRLKACKK